MKTQTSAGISSAYRVILELFKTTSCHPKRPLFSGPLWNMSGSPFGHVLLVVLQPECFTITLHHHTFRIVEKIVGIHLHKWLRTNWKMTQTVAWSRLPLGRRNRSLWAWDLWTLYKERPPPSWGCGWLKVCLKCLKPSSNAPVIWSPTLGMTGTFNPVKFPATGAKILSEIPSSRYSAVQSKVPCVESAVTAFLESSHETLKSIIFYEKRKREPVLRK